MHDSAQRSEACMPEHDPEKACARASTRGWIPLFGTGSCSTDKRQAACPPARLAFALKLVACAFAGATVAILLWPSERRAADRGSLRSFEAVTPAFASSEPLAREVKTVKFTVLRP